MEGRKMVRMSSINLHVRCGEIEGDWVTIGVLVSKGEPRTSQKVQKDHFPLLVVSVTDILNSCRFMEVIIYTAFVFHLNKVC